MGRVLGLFIYYLSKWSDRSVIHLTKNLKSVIRLLSEHLKYPYPYPFIYMLTDGQTDERFGRFGRTGRVGFGGFLPTPRLMVVHHNVKN